MLRVKNNSSAIEIHKKGRKEVCQTQCCSIDTTIEDVIKPKSDTSRDVDDLIEHALDSRNDNVEPMPRKWMHFDWMGRGPFEIVVVTGLLDSSTLLKYEKKRLGYVPVECPRICQDGN